MDFKIEFDVEDTHLKVQDLKSLVKDYIILGFNNEVSSEDYHFPELLKTSSKCNKEIDKIKFLVSKQKIFKKEIYADHVLNELLEEYKHFEAEFYFVFLNSILS